MMQLALLLVVSNVQAQECVPIDIHGATEEVWRLWRTNGAASALNRAELAWARPANACAADARELGRLAQVAGVVAFFDVQADVTDRWFRRALEVAPNLAFGEDLGAEPRKAYEGLRDHMQVGPSVPPVPLQQEGDPLVATRKTGSEEGKSRLIGPVLVTGVGVGVFAGGAGLWGATFNGPFLACTDADDTYNFGDGGLRRCESDLGGQVYGRWLGSVALMATGGAAVAAGLGLFIVPGRGGTVLGVAGSW